MAREITDEDSPARKKELDFENGVPVDAKKKEDEDDEGDE